MDGITEERRVHQRRAIRLPLVYEKGGRSFWSLTEDLSLGGAFLQTFHPPEEGERLHLRLKRSDFGEECSLTGRVVHRRPRNRAALPEGGALVLPSGVGVAFEEIPGRAREKLENLLAVDPNRSISSRSFSAASAEDTEDLYTVRDPDAILKTLRCVCRKILPLHVRRLGGSISYATYIRDIFLADGSPTVAADPVPLQDADRAFSDRVPFVFRFSHRERTWSFVVEENPGRLAGEAFSFALPAELRFREERRQDRFGEELKPLLTVEFPDPLDPGLNRVKNVLDVSYGGLAFKTYPGEEVYTAGAVLEGMALYATTDRACRVSDGVVKYAELVCLPSGEVYQRVGVAFSETGFPRLREVPAFREDEMEEMTRPEAILQHLRRVCQSGARILTGRENCILFSDGVLQSERSNGGLDFRVVSSHLARAPRNLFEEGELSYHYLLHGIYHFFVARTSRENGGLRLEIPRKIYKAKRRRVLRVSCEGDLEARFRFVHPVLGQECVFPIRDLSIRGLAFDCDYVRHLLWKGFLLRDCKVELGQEILSVGPVEVRSLTLRGGDPDRGQGKTCGVEFFDLPAPAEKRISEYIFKKSNPHIVQVAVEKIENLWQLFAKSGFLYPGKAAYLERIKQEVDETWKKLLSGEADFFKQIAFWEGGQELGTASAVLAYEDCWLFQHLAATGHPVKLVPKYVILGLAQFLMEHREIHYLITYFRKENSFPWKIYSGFLEVYPLEEQLKFTRHQYLTRDLDDEIPEKGRFELPVRCRAEGIVVEHAAAADYEIVENCLRRQVHPLLIRSRSLQRGTFELRRISAAYRARGLVRERFCLVARDRGELAAFALAENASLGVNLSGLLNTFSVWSVRRDSRVPAIRRKLIEVVAQFYRSLGARTAICLTQEEDVSDYLAAGFRKEKEYICFTSSRRAIKSYYDYVQERFSRFEERRERAGRELPF